MHYQLLHGDNREQLKHLEDNSIDSIVCDPPYELGFMGKRWDSTGIAYDGTVWTECLRVLKPGGHLIAFGGTRTYHRMTVAIEDAGFEIRDCIMWLYGSGFPKSHDVSKALDKQAGAEQSTTYIPQSENDIYGHGKGKAAGVDRTPGAVLSSPPATDLAKQWHGYGTALKPAVEPAVLARKPLIGTVADNVTTWGVGGINVDGCRIPSNDGYEKAWDRPVRTNISNGSQAFDTGTSAERGTHLVDISANKPSGRWPANVILDESAGDALDAQSGVSASVTRNPTGKYILNPDTGWNNNSMTDTTTRGYSDIGGASRFFYTAKASKAEREAGLDAPDGQRGNIHATVKPIALMRYLVRLVTPKGGTVLDPFMGSGSTGCAAMCEGMNFVGIELSEEYLEIARRRIEYWQSQNPMGL